MPVISNATVATGTGLSTQDNGGRKIVRLANEWLVVGVVANSGGATFYKSSDNGLTWTRLCRIDDTSTKSIAMVSYGNQVHVLTEHSFSSTYIYSFDASTITDVDLSSSTYRKIVDSGQNFIGEVALGVNESGTELHAAWSSTNNTYSASYNIRYAKITVDGSGNTTVGTKQQLTTENTSQRNYKNPSVIVNASGQPVILTDYNTNTGSCSVLSIWFNGSVWTQSNVYSGIYQVASTSSLFVPQTVNGLTNGRIWAGFQAVTGSSGGKFNIFVTYSDNGGSTWASSYALTSGNTFDRSNVTLSADKVGKVFALYEDHQWSPDIGIRMKTYNGSWGVETSVATANTAERYPSSLVDFRLEMTTPPFVYTDTTEGIRFTGNFPLGASVSPTSGSLGSKETPTITAYTVTPEAGSTVTQIVERINGAVVNTYNNPASLSRTLTVPTGTWDTLAYFATHTASITVTDSNGATTVTTYSFDKRLATGASLLEATKANTDAKNRISQKRDTLAAQVGLSAGSTFDAIIAQLVGGDVLKKVVSGTATISPATSLTVRGLAFKPLFVVADSAQGWRQVIFNNTKSPANNALNNYMFNTDGIYSSPGQFYNDGFQILFNKNGSVSISASWIAFG